MRNKYKPGDIYNSWTLVEYDRVTKRWVCKCVCGTLSKVHSWSLSHGKSKGCKVCSGQEIPKGLSGIKRKIRQVKKQAVQRNLSYLLTDAEAKVLISGECYYCGVEPYQMVGDTTNSRFLCNGIDRLNNLEGYTFSNCVSCCGPCNRAKDTMTKDNFLFLVHKIASRHPLRKVV